MEMDFDVIVAGSGAGGGAFAHVIGYVAKVSADDVKRAGPNPDPILLHPGFRIGKQGVEKSFDLDLRGRPGAKRLKSTPMVVKFARIRWGISPQLRARKSS